MNAVGKGHVPTFHMKHPAWSTKRAVTSHCENHVRKNCEHGGDMGSASEDMDHFDFKAHKPNLSESGASDEAKKKTEMRQLKLQCTVEQSVTQLKALNYLTNTPRNRQEPRERFVVISK